MKEPPKSYETRGHIRPGDRVKLEDYVFSLTGIDITNSKVESVIINGFDNNIFYARLLLSQHDKPVDCPPAIALALGARAQAPIFAEEAVLGKAGIDVPA